MYILATWVLHIQIFTDVTSAHHRIITRVCVSAVLDFSTEIRISVTLTKDSKVHQHYQLMCVIWRVDSFRGRRSSQTCVDGGKLGVQ